MDDIEKALKELKQDLRNKFKIDMEIILDDKIQIKPLTETSLKLINEIQTFTDNFLNKKFPHIKYSSLKRDCGYGYVNFKNAYLSVNSENKISID